MWFYHSIYHLKVNLKRHFRLKLLISLGQVRPTCGKLAFDLSKLKTPAEFPKIWKSLQAG